MDYLNYLRPPKRALDIQHPREYIVCSFGDQLNRKIFYDKDLEIKEVKAIEEFRQYLNKKNIEIPPEWTQANYLKLVHANNFDVTKVEEFIKIHFQWINDPQYHINIDKNALQILVDLIINFQEDGIIYQHGRDKQLRPVIYFQACNLKQRKLVLQDFLVATSYLFGQIQRNMFLDGKIENWIIIVDLEDLSVTNIPIDLIKQFIFTLNIHFSNTLEKLLLINSPFLIKAVFHVIIGFLHPITQQKNKLIGSGQSGQKKLQNYISPDQLQKKYGGFLENIKTYWYNQFNSFQIIKIIMQKYRKDQMKLKTSQ